MFTASGATTLSGVWGRCPRVGGGLQRGQVRSRPLRCLAYPRRGVWTPEAKRRERVGQRPVGPPQLASKAILAQHSKSLTLLPSSELLHQRLIMLPVMMIV